MCDALEAADLTDDHLGRRIRVSGHEGVLHALYVDDEFVQILLVDGGPPQVPTVGAGAAVELLD